MNVIRIVMIGMISVSINICHAQQQHAPSAIRKKEYHVKITLTDGQKVKAVIRSVGIYSLRLDDVVYKKSHGVRPVENERIVNNEVRYGSTRSIRVRNFGATLLGTVTGATLGVAGGGLVGFIFPYWLCDDCSSENVDTLEDWNVIFVTTIIGATLGGTILGIAGGQVGIPVLEVDGSEGFQKFVSKMEKKGVPMH